MPKKVTEKQISGLAEIAAKADGHQLLDGVKGTIYPFGRVYDLGVSKDSDDLKTQLLLPWMVLVIDKIINGKPVLGVKFSGRNVLVRGATYYELNGSGTPTYSSRLQLASKRVGRHQIELEIKQTLWPGEDRTFGEYKIQATLDEWSDDDTKYTVAWTSAFPVVRADEVSSCLRALDDIPKHPTSIQVLTPIFAMVPDFCEVRKPHVFYWPVDDQLSLKTPLGACGDDQLMSFPFSKDQLDCIFGCANSTPGSASDQKVE